MKKLMTKIGKLEKEIEIDGNSVSIEDMKISLIKSERGQSLVKVNGDSYLVDDVIELDEKDVYRIEIGGYTIDVKVEDPVSQALSGMVESSGDVESPMSGQISNVYVKEGQKVHEGQLLLVISAMKMENKINSPIDGTVSKINTDAGESVQVGKLLVVINPDSED
jgi:pyruvate carboxylase subunit B